MHVCACMCMFARVRVFLCVHMCACLHVCMCVLACVHVRVCVLACVRVCMHVCARTCMCVHVRVQGMLGGTQILPAPWEGVGRPGTVGCKVLLGLHHEDLLVSDTQAKAGSSPPGWAGAAASRASGLASLPASASRVRPGPCACSDLPAPPGLRSCSPLCPSASQFAFRSSRPPCTQPPASVQHVAPRPGACQPALPSAAPRVPPLHPLCCEWLSRRLCCLLSPGCQLHKDRDVCLFRATAMSPLPRIAPGTREKADSTTAGQLGE